MIGKHCYTSFALARSLDMSYTIGRLRHACCFAPFCQVNFEPLLDWSPCRHAVVKAPWAFFGTVKLQSCTYQHLSLSICCAVTLAGAANLPDMLTEPGGEGNLAQLGGEAGASPLFKWTSDGSMMEELMKAYK